jgi:hypothetical protein
LDRDAARGPRPALNRLLGATRRRCDIRLIPGSAVFFTIRAIRFESDMETVEVKILKYAFRFRRLSWREEFGIKFEQKSSRLRTVLTYALKEVSGFPINSLEEAKRVLAPIPQTIIDRMFVIYKGSLPTPRAFSTMGLYRAPEPRKFTKKVMEAEEEREKIMDRVEERVAEQMAVKFGRKEIQETLDAERQMAKNSKMRGATRATPDEGRFGATPPVGGKKKDAH